MKIFSRKCLDCGKAINTFCPQKFYCGKQKTKTGCAYKRQLQKVAQWNKEHLELMKKWNVGAVKRYYEKNRKAK